MIRLYSADLCPYAQRTRALLTHLGERFEPVVVDLARKTPEFLALSPTGRVPMLVDGDLTLYESMVINAYVAERFAWKDAHSQDVGRRARERLAMLQFDQVVLPGFMASLKGTLDDAPRKSLERELVELERTVLAADAPVNLLAFHVVTHAARMLWMGDASVLPALLDARPKLRGWIDATLALPAVQETLPDREATVAVYRRVFMKTAS